MKKLSVLCSILTFATGMTFAAECAGGVCPLPGASKKPVEITTAELSVLVDSGTVTLIDARPGAPMGLPGAKPLTGTPSAEEAAKVIPAKDAPVVTYCGGVTCPLSPMMAKHLQSLGYTNVREYPEGFAGWKAAGRPVTALK
jgi:rhodanese-related sulfurtransferase